MKKTESKYRIIFTGGGTGGHLFPLVSVAEKVRELIPDSELLFIGTRNKLESKVERKLKEIYDDKGIERPKYQGELPEGNNGLGLLLLGITGDQILPEDVYSEIKANTICRVRGTVQADILKEDQAQNTCIFSTDFSLKLMGDMQEYFCRGHRSKEQG